MSYKYNGGTLALDVPFKDTAGTSYPGNWLRLSNATQRAAVPGGITWVQPAQVFDSRFYLANGDAKPLAGLKSLWIEKQKRFAKDLLVKSDWMVVRAAEGGTAIPSDNKTYRAAVRTKSKEREDQITAASDAAALINLINNDEYKGGTGGLKRWPAEV
jgi:hypothetical protein